MPIRIAIVDDNVRLAKNLRSDLLEFGEIESIVTCNSGLRFAKDLELMPGENRPQAIIMDISMGLADEGIRATRQIKSRFPEIHIIMFTISDDDDRVFDAFRAGAMGYLLKSEPPSFVLKTILDVTNGGAQMSPGIARKAIRFFAPEVASQKKPVKASDHGDHPLSARELEILTLVSKGLTYQKIADLLFISFNTVKKHMVHIFNKLNVNNKIEAIKKSDQLKAGSNEILHENPLALSS